MNPRATSAGCRYMDVTAMKHASVGMAVFLFSLISAAPVTTVYAQDENITVSCFKGNLDEGNNVGELSVSKVENAGQDCNNFYEDCQGQCLGCVYDDNLSREVCYDQNGTKILK